MFGIDLLLALLFYGPVAAFIVGPGLSMWLSPKERDEKQMGAQIFLFGLFWPVTVPLGVVTGLLWLLWATTRDAFKKEK